MDKNKLKLPSFVNSNGILFNDNCLNVMSEIESDKLDCIFADPPFNLNKQYNGAKSHDNKTESEYEEWLKKCLSEFSRILKPGGSLFIYHMPYYLVKISTYLNNLPKMTFRHWIALSMKNGFPIKNRLQPAHYGLLYYVKEGDAFTFNVVRTQTPKCRHCGDLIKDYGGYRGKFKKWEDVDGIPWVQISDFWDDTRPARHDKKRPNKINELPYEIAERVILLSSKKGDVIYDPFAGGGSTIYAACINDRHWLGTEIGEVDTIIRLLISYDKKVSTLPPRKIINIFKQRNDTSNYSLSNKNQKYISKIILGLNSKIDDEKINNKNRYSHRMTNRVFD